jgi:hypothetical protein
LKTQNICSKWTVDNEKSGIGKKWNICSKCGVTLFDGCLKKKEQHISEHGYGLLIKDADAMKYLLTHVFQLILCWGDGKD